MRNCFFTLVVAFGNFIFAQDHPAIEKYECHKEVHEIIAGMLDSNEQGTLKSEEDLKERLERAMKLIGNDKSKFVSELVCFTTIPKHDVGSSMLHVGLIQYMKISREEIFYGVLSCMLSENESIRKQAYRWLEDGWFAIDEDKNLPFPFYEKMFIKDINTQFPGLVDHMYSKSPEQALSTMANVYMTKEESAELMRQVRTTPAWKTKPWGFSDNDIVGDPQTMATLSRRSEWWILLYVAKRMQKNSQSFSEEALTNLKKCQHPLVVQTVAAMTENKLK